MNGDTAVKRGIARGGLFRKYAAVLILLVGGVLLVSSVINLYFSYRQTRAALVRVQRQQALAAASRIEQFVHGIQEQVRATMEVPFSDVALAREQREIDFLRLLRDTPAIAEIVQLDAAGKVELVLSRFAVNEVGGQRDLSRDPRFTKTRIGHVYFGPVHFRDGSGPYLTIAVPWGEGAPEVAAAEVSLRAMSSLIAGLHVGATGYVYVVDHAGIVVAHPDMSVVLEKRDVSDLPQIRAARLGGSADLVTEASGLQGGRALTTHASIEPLGWLVLVEQPLAEALAPLRGSIVLSAVFFLVGLGLSIVASLVLARRMVAPIRALQQGAAKIGAGELGHRIDVRSGDELQALGDQFNRTAAQLEESYATLEQKVELRTRELGEANARLRALSDVAQAVNSSLDLERVLNVIAGRAAQLSASEWGLIYEYDPARSEFHLKGSDNLDDELVDVIRAAPIRLGEGVAGRAAATRAPAQVADVRDERTYDVVRIRAILEHRGLRSMLAVPLLGEERIIGALVVGRQQTGLFTADAVDLLQAFASQSVSAIQNARLFRELADKSRQLEMASQHKSEFLANMSHELRTPLNAIIGFSEVLSERMFGELTDKQEEYLRDIHTSGEHLLSLINDILDLSKIEAGRMELELSDFHLPTTIDNALMLVRERASRRGITLHQAIDERLGSILGDERKIKQVLLNLLSNALKFTPENGRVEVRGERVDGMAEISVTDTGIGIALQDQEAVFEEFRQVGTAAKTVEGTGLGLALSRRFIELHGGRIWVKSELGAGSTFTFTLPLATDRGGQSA